MLRLFVLALGLACALWYSPAVLAVSAVNPFGVNVRASGQTTVKGAMVMIN